jgi:phage terminase large subunit-like protein
MLHGLALALKTAIESNPYSLYTPGPIHQEFHDSPSRFRLLIAGTQCGKTQAGVWEAWTHALQHPGSTGIIVTANHTASVEVVGQKMDQMAPRHMLASNSDYNPSRGWRNGQILLKNGSKILFRSGESRSISIAGLTAHWLWFDEPPPQEMWADAISRVAVHRGPVWVTMTPVGRPVGWFRDIVEAPNTLEPWHVTNVHLTAEHLPWRDPQDIEAQRQTYGPWEYQQRVYGAWEGETKSRYFPSFGPDTLIKPEEIPYDQYDVALGIDHGEGTGKQVAILLLYSKQRNLLIALDEYVSKMTTTPEEDAHAIKAMLARHHIAVTQLSSVVGDTNSLGKGMAGLKVNDLLGSQLGVRIQKAKKGPGSVEYGSRMLHYAMLRGHLRVSTHCKRLMECLSHWEGDNTNLKDAIDALRYVTVPIYERMLSPTEVDRLRLSRG